MALAVFSGALVAGLGPAQACHNATRTRILPLGTVGGELIALSLTEWRGGQMDIQWSVEPAVVAISPLGATVVRRRLAEREFGSETELNEAMRKVLQQQLRIAGRLKGFQPLRMDGQVECEHRTRCGVVTLEAGDLALTVRVSKTAAVVIPASELDQLYREPVNYELAQVRRYQTALGTWIVALLRAGDARCSSLVDADAGAECARPKMTSKPGTSVVDSAAVPPIYHHGFDKAVVILNAAP